MKRRSFFKLLAFAGGLAVLPAPIAAQVLSLADDAELPALPVETDDLYLLSLTVVSGQLGIVSLFDGDTLLLSVPAIPNVAVAKDFYALGVPRLRGKLRIESDIDALAVARCAADGGKGSIGISSIDDLMVALSRGTETFILTCERSAR